MTSAGCSSATTAANPSPSPIVTPSPSAPASSSPSPSPSPTVAAQPAPASTVTVAFSGLRSGVYPAHLHSRCSGSQAFHLLVLANLIVGANGSGSVEVPASYAGRGFCVIVYTSRTFASVLATRQV
jgi:hypothetical protein